MSEKDRAMLLLGDFDAYKSRAWKLIKEMTQNEITRSSLVAFATTVSYLIKKKMKRDYMRRKELLIMWFEENYDEIYKLKDNFCFDFAFNDRMFTIKGVKYHDICSQDA